MYLILRPGLVFSPAGISRRYKSKNKFRLFKIFIILLKRGYLNARNNIIIHQRNFIIPHIRIQYADLLRFGYRLVKNTRPGREKLLPSYIFFFIYWYINWSSLIWLLTFLLVQKSNKKRPPQSNTARLRVGSLIKLLYYCSFNIYGLNISPLMNFYVNTALQILNAEPTLHKCWP